MTNFVKKVIYQKDTDTITFIIKTEDDTDFWCWEIQNQVWLDYWGKKGEQNPIYYISRFNYSPSMCEEFANDPDNSDKGTSWGGFVSLEQALQDIGIIQEVK